MALRALGQSHHSTASMFDAPIKSIDCCLQLRGAFLLSKTGGDANERFMSQYFTINAGELSLAISDYVN